MNNQVTVCFYTLYFDHMKIFIQQNQMMDCLKHIMDDLKALGNDKIRVPEEHHLDVNE